MPFLKLLNNIKRKHENKSNFDFFIILAITFLLTTYYS